jgi:hypothetical protein
MTGRAPPLFHAKLAWLYVRRQKVNSKAFVPLWPKEKPAGHFCSAGLWQGMLFIRSLRL